VLALAYLVLATALNAVCPAIFAKIETWLFVALAGACCLAILYVAVHPNPRSRVLVQVATGTVAGMFLQPSTSGIVAVAMIALSLGAIPRTSFIGGVALFAFGLAAGLGVLILTSTPSARC
jgi:hypothetical protein